MPPRVAVRDLLARRFPRSRVTEMAGDASVRTFFRIETAERHRRVLMDYGEPFRGETGDIRATRLFARAGLPVATLIAAFPEEGCLLFSDLGDRDLESVYEAASPSRKREWLECAVDLAADIRLAGTRALTGDHGEDGVALDRERFRFEMEFFVEHYVLGRSGRGSDTRELRRLLSRLADRAAAAGPRALCHRDFHSRNLIVTGEDELAAVDLQDARWGPDGYDLASILRDAYIEVDEASVPGLIERFIAGARIRDARAFRDRFELVAAQRMLKALGTFGFQLAAGRERYRSAIPRTLARLDSTLAGNPRLSELDRSLRTTGVL